MSVSTSPTARSVWRGARGSVLIGLLVVLVGVFVALVTGGGGPARHLDPHDASVVGGKALAQLLRARGVQVDRADSVGRAEELGRESGRLLLVSTTRGYSSEDQARLTKIPGARLTVGANPDLDLGEPSVRNRSREPRCDLEAARLAGSAYMGGFTFKGATCYDGTLVRQGALTAVGSGEFMTNLRLAEDGNAALALNLLDGVRAVTWLVEAPPSGELAGPEGKTLTELMPPSIPWAVLMAVLAVLVTAFWRGRRLGPVVTEQLPVVVRAAETVEGRGRLYRARRARGRAADALRAGALDRIVPRLGLASGAGREAVVSAIAVRTGHDPRQIGDALYGGPPADDAGLVALAGYLDFLERTVVTQ
ncbi:DUF4350 domain-containing protein [Nonomuraea sp. NPDC050556]|uniref:DUF4350 domain-containing protein n=1 Tax=Nonomuraea sp. NPDC050556 TaxID=3364369 RepID=UPI0037AF5D4A